MGTDFVHKNKFWILFVLTPIILSWSIWYMVQYRAALRTAIHQKATALLMCPSEQLSLGPYDQWNDGPTEVVVQGCGKMIKLFCEDRPLLHQIWKVYTSFFITCSDKLSL